MQHNDQKPVCSHKALRLHSHTTSRSLTLLVAVLKKRCGHLLPSLCFSFSICLSVSLSLSVSLAFSFSLSISLLLSNSLILSFSIPSLRLKERLGHLLPSLCFFLSLSLSLCFLSLQIHAEQKAWPPVTFCLFSIFYLRSQIYDKASNPNQSARTEPHVEVPAPQQGKTDKCRTN